MQHLSNAYEELGPDAIRYRDISDCITRQGEAEGHGFQYHDFIRFPLQHGYEVDEKYRLSATLQNVRCRIHDGRSLDEDEFLQAWLFFGILRCVVRTEEPIMPVNTLIREGVRLNTGGLPDALEKWDNYIRGLARNSSHDAEMRCIEAMQMLTLARRVVIANLADGSYPSNRENEREKRALCLMVLGETLSAALAHTMENCNINIRDWHLEQDGWGPPAYVTNKMNEDHWCKRFQEVLKGQVGRSATLMYVSFKFRPPGDRTSAVHPHLECTTNKCEFIEAYQEMSHDGQLSAGYRPLQHPGCRLNHRPGQGDDYCRMVGPNENALMDVLDTSQGRNGVFPLLRIHGRGRTAEVRIESWSEDTDVRFATISHVWAHGLGNRTEPRIWQCQLDHIRQLLEVVFGPQAPEEGDKSHLFWLDTLAIPVVRANETDERRLRLRQQAVSLIYHVFDQADHGVIIDRHLLGYESAEDRLTIGVRLLSSGWMKRLWTLQEAFVTRNLSLAMEGGRVKNIDRLWNGNMEPNVMNDSLAALIQLKLSQNLMGDEREARIRTTPDLNPNGSTEQHGNRWSLLIASAWRSARYRVRELESAFHGIHVC
jgi:hypothetical protein